MMPTRREILFDGALALLWTSAVLCPCAAEAKSKPRPYHGCALGDAEAREVFGKAGAQRIYGHGDEPMVAHSGNRDFDIALAQMLASISTEFGVLPGFAYYDDSDGMNAYATPISRLSRADGTVLFGQRLLAEQLALKENPEIAVTTVCAHEFGHIVQFKLKLTPRLLAGQTTVKRTELHADFMAGYFAGLRKKRRPDFPAQTFAMTMESVGDSQFRRPQHHGTPTERAAAVIKGFDTGFREQHGFGEAVEQGVQYAISV
jgi:hypothetical protein